MTLHIWHSGVGPKADAVNGVDQMVWALGEAQVASGCRVTFLTAATYEQRYAAGRLGIQLAQFDEATSGVPGVIHMHSVFNPKQARLALWAKRRRIPYVITPNGGVARPILRRNPLKKWAYSTLVERPRFRSAASVTAVAPAEVEEIARFARIAPSTVAFVPNAVRLPPRSIESRTVEDCVYLGRLDVQHKGIDILSDFASHLPHLTFGIYGKGVRGRLPEFPSNVHLHEPVYGDAKWSILKSARAYIQLSRWEAFGLSVCEAALVDTPPILSSTMNIAPLLAGYGGLTIDIHGDLASQADRVSAFMHQIDSRPGDPDLKSGAVNLVDPRLVARRFLAVYDKAVAAARP